MNFPAISFPFKLTSRHLSDEPFFFVSGFLFYKMERQWNFSTMCKMVVDKAKNLFVPTFIFFCLYTFIFNEDFIAEIDTDAKSGYWFTITLYWFITIYSIVITVFRGSRWGKLFLFVLSVPMLWSNNHVLYELIPFNFLSVGKLRYFIFFLLGTFVKEYFVFFERMLDCRWIMSLLIPLFVLLSICAFNTDMPENMSFSVCGCIGLTIVFIYFKHYERSFTKDSTLGISLQYIGRRTLDVYLLHYFFLPRHLEDIGSFFSKNSNPTIELFLTLLIALLVITLCLITSNAIRLSPQLASWTLGEKQNVNEASIDVTKLEKVDD